MDTPAFIPPTEGIKIVEISCNGTAATPGHPQARNSFAVYVGKQSAQLGRSSTLAMDFPPKLSRR